ncbi:MAG: hypothetical protein M3Q08_01075 [Pseudomonadota bacterium]|nr:hypothetical protein [Pseudomonadota bacterium]
MTEAEKLITLGAAHCAAAQSDPNSNALAADLEALIGRHIGRGVDGHTVIVIMAAAIGFAIGQGSRKHGNADTFADGLEAAQTALEYAARDVFVNGGRVSSH